MCGGWTTIPGNDNNASKGQAAQPCGRNSTTKYTGVRRLLHTKVGRTAAVIISSLILPLLFLECYWCLVTMVSSLCPTAPRPVEGRAPELSIWVAAGLLFFFTLFLVIATMPIVLVGFFMWFAIDAQLRYIHTLINLSMLPKEADEEELPYVEEEDSNHYSGYFYQYSSQGIIQPPNTPDPYESEYETDHEAGTTAPDNWGSSQQYFPEGLYEESISSAVPGSGQMTPATEFSETAATLVGQSFDDTNRDLTAGEVSYLPISAGTTVQSNEETEILGGDLSLNKPPSYMPWAT
ncbi:hypothetical protein FHETE_4589 [Fusarium heterosporum]|uniref:Uncharacterized protein n=1 Tax=Fusarium heterosporum TaxID=42747 RepID=A0A8H5WP63_FUSHE|nr:hypothetical protein FHETE_4589 [Fusarium heterosporum]